MERIELARLIATGAHYGQVDKGGHPYIGHPAAVASLVETEDEKIVAWLHDVVEDTDVTCDDIHTLFGARIANAVDAITHKKGEDRLLYLGRVKINPLARAVKIADLKHNSQLERIACRELTVKDYDRRDRYQREIKFLNA